jgi:lipid-binding SYLF domain-containing protein
VVPSLKKGGFIFGANYGKGLATCRTAKGWSAPAPIKIEGGSWGAQIGGEAVDLIMLVMNHHGMEQLLDSKFKLGADVSGAAGPVGREAAANTDWKLRSEVLTYSRSRGAFAGITLNGAKIAQDDQDTRLLYGRDVPFRTILSGEVAPPRDTRTFLQAVNHDFALSKAAEHKSAANTAGSGGTAGTLTGHGEVAKPAPPQSVAGAAQESATNNPNAATPVSDAKQVQDELAAALKDKLGNDADNIVIAVNANTIRLSGTVPSDDEKDKAISVVQSKAGDRHVDASGLKVK